MKYLNKIMIFLFWAFDIWYVYDRLSRGVTDRLLIALAIIPILIIPWLIKKVFRYEMNDTMKFAYYLFTFCCVVLGSILNFYNIPQTRGFDKFTHFISGFLSSIVALLMLKKANLKNKKMWFTITYIILFSTAIAGFWEYIEFTWDHIAGLDTQHVLDTGVSDTMGDMLVATLASILFSIYYWYQTTKAKVNRMEKLEQSL